MRVLFNGRKEHEIQSRTSRNAYCGRGIYDTLYFASRSKSGSSGDAGDAGEPVPFRNDKRDGTTTRANSTDSRRLPRYLTNFAVAAALATVGCDAPAKDAGATIPAPVIDGGIARDASVKKDAHWHTRWLRDSCKRCPHCCTHSTTPKSKVAPLPKKPILVQKDQTARLRKVRGDLREIYKILKKKPVPAKKKRSP